LASFNVLAVLRYLVWPAANPPSELLTSVQYISLQVVMKSLQNGRSWVQLLPGEYPM